MNSPRLKEKFNKELVAQLKEKFNYSSVMQVPRLKSIAINKGLGRAVADKKIVQDGVEELTLITGQRAVSTVAKKAISNFKLREDMPIGARVTLRGNRMYEFLDRLISVSLPRVRDFRGVKDKGFDGRGNYTLGVREQIIFPEISIDQIKDISGMNITFVTSAKTDEEGFELLKLFGIPFASLGDK